MTTQTRSRPKAGKTQPSVLAPNPFDAQVDYVEAFICGRLTLDGYTARKVDIAQGAIPSVRDLVLAYRDAYVDELRDPDTVTLLLAAFVDAVRDGEASGLADYFEEYLNADGASDRLAVLSGGVATKPTRKRRTKTQDPLEPPAYTPLPGQGELPLSDDQADATEVEFNDELDAELDAELDDTAVAPEYDAKTLDRLRADAKGDAAVVAAKRVAAGKGSQRLWPVGVPLRYRAGRHWVLGTLVEDHGNGQLTMARTNRVDEKPWTVARSRCKRLKTAEVVAAPVPAEDTRKFVLEIPEGELAQVTGWLALESVDGFEAEAKLARYFLELPDEWILLVDVVNGTPRVGRRSYVQFLVLDAADRFDYEHPPCDRLAGTHMLAMAGRPVLLEVVANYD